MAIISVRVSDEVKKRMEKLSHVNWSEVLRKAILRVLEEEEGRNLALALLLNEKVRKKAPEGWDSTEFIRRWREYRYG
ncbi:MAG: type II toxin-antitoxin system ParD family antitoxin [Crenarchaeota archaeon]|nr:type II toxin-antitoxin system ParD family antitoxin [Thermoproteota archaeon]